MVTASLHFRIMCLVSDAKTGSACTCQKLDFAVRNYWEQCLWNPSCLTATATDVGGLSVVQLALKLTPFLVLNIAENHSPELTTLVLIMIKSGRIYVLAGMVLARLVLYPSDSKAGKQCY